MTVYNSVWPRGSKP